MKSEKKIDLKQTLAVAFGVFLICILSGEAQALVTGKLTGTVVDAAGQPKGNFTLVFTPVEGSNNSTTRKIKVKKNGTFKLPFFPTGRYKVSSADPDLFVKHMKLLIKDPAGMEISSHEGDAHPVQGLPPVPISGGMNVFVDLVVIDGTAKDKLVQQFDLHEASGELKSILKLLEARNYEKALANLEKILEKKPDLGAAHYLKGQTLLRMERYGEAVAEYRRTLELDKEQPGVPGNLALAMLRHGEQLAESGDKKAAEALYESSVAMFDTALKNDPAGMALLTSRAAALERLGDQERIVAALKGILEADSENLQVRLRLSDILIKDGQAAEAAKVLDELVSEELSVANSLFNLAVHFYNEGQLEPAVVAVEKAIKINPELAAGYRLLGRARMSQGDQEGAVQALEKFLELAPDDPSADTERNLIKALQAG